VKFALDSRFRGNERRVWGHAGEMFAGMSGVGEFTFSAHPRGSGGPGRNVRPVKFALDSRLRGNERRVCRHAGQMFRGNERRVWGHAGEMFAGMSGVG
jgi:hypothetical protein